MTELLHRVHSAIPLVADWIDTLVQRHLQTSLPVRSVAAFADDAWFPATILDDARFALVSSVPFPPVAAYGLHEFEPMAAMPMAGITFRNMYFLDEAQASDAIHFHELVHVVQWQTLGVMQFLYTYALQLLQFDYVQSPFEALAYDLQHRFESGASPLNMGVAIAAHAIAHRDAALRIYREHGIGVGA